MHCRNGSNARHTTALMLDVLGFEVNVIIQDVFCQLVDSDKVHQFQSYGKYINRNVRLF